MVWTGALTQMAGFYWHLHLVQAKNSRGPVHYHQVQEVVATIVSWHRYEHEREEVQHIIVPPQRSHFFILFFPIFQWHNLYHNCCSFPQPFCILQCETLNHHITLLLINVGSLRFRRSWMQKWPKAHGKSMKTAASWPYTMEQHDHHPKPQPMDSSQAVPVSGWSS